MSSRALEGVRTMHKNIPNYLDTWAEEQVTFTEANGWRNISAGGNGVYYETYFDLSGYTLDDLTVFPAMITLQDGMPYYWGQGQGSLTVYDIVCDERITNWADWIFYPAFGKFPGSADTTEDFQQVLMCNVRKMFNQTNFTGTTFCATATAGSYGSNSPTTVEKLWLYRIVLCSSPQAGDQLIIPNTRFVMTATVAKEDDLPYLMRLKRSFELGTQGD